MTGQPIKPESAVKEVPHAPQQAQGPHAPEKQHMPHGEDRLRKAIDLVTKHPLMADAVVIFMILALAGGFLVWQDMQNKIYIEKAEVSAPIISLGPGTTGIIDKFYVKEGDRVAQGQKLAVVGNETIYAGTQGIIISIENTPGQIATPQSAVVKMIDDSQLRVVGRVQEDKGLSDIRPGQKVMFTVDAFGSKEYQGVVESVGASARESDIVFSISDKRAEQEFDVTVLFDSKAYSELKNGMSAKMWVYKS